MHHSCKFERKTLIVFSCTVFCTTKKTLYNEFYRLSIEDKQKKRKGKKQSTIDFTTVV